MRIHQAIAEMIALDEQPFSIVEDNGFLHYTRTLEPRYKVPSRKYITETVLPDIHARVLGKVGMSLKDVSSICFTTDMWTSSVTNKSFIALTGHWIDSQFTRKGLVLNVKPFTGSHTGAEIGSSISGMMTAWHLNASCCHLFVRDSGANIVKALRDLKLRSVSCFAHSIQLSIQDALFVEESVKVLITACRKIVGHFNHSASASDRLPDLQREDSANGTKVKKLIQDVATRWNSTYYMLESLSDQSRVLQLYALEQRAFTTLTVDQWELLEKVLEVLQPFEEITKEVCYDESSISLVIPSVSVLKKALLEKNEADETMQILKACLFHSIDERFTYLYTSEPHTIATVLDPRFKLTCFDEQQSAMVRSGILKSLKELKKQVSVANSG